MGALVTADYLSFFWTACHYQATQPGFSNSGHNYPRRPLSESDQKALLEYLKTL